MNCIKTAGLGTYRDVSSPETPFSDCGRMSAANVIEFINEKQDVSRINVKDHII